MSNLTVKSLTPVKTRKGATTPAETLTGATTPAETLTGATTPAETLTGATTPAETLTGATTPAETLTGATTPAETLTGATTPAETLTGATTHIPALLGKQWRDSFAAHIKTLEGDQLVTKGKGTRLASCGTDRAALGKAAHALIHSVDFCRLVHADFSPVKGLWAALPDAHARSLERHVRLSMAKTIDGVMMVPGSDVNPRTLKGRAVAKAIAAYLTEPEPECISMTGKVTRKALPKGFMAHQGRVFAAWLTFEQGIEDGLTVLPDWFIPVTI